MRSGWNLELQKWVQRTEAAGRVIVEAITVEADDVLSSRDDWSTRTTVVSGQTVLLEDGGIRLVGPEIKHADHAGTAATDPTDTTIGDLDEETPIRMAEIEWPTGLWLGREIHSVAVRINPQVNTQVPQQVTHWQAVIYRVTSTQTDEVGANITIQPIGHSKRVASPIGSDPVDISLSFIHGNEAIPTIGSPPQGDPKPRTLLQLIAFSATGFAANCAWLANPVGTQDLGNGISTYGTTLDAIVDASGASSGRTFVTSPGGSLGRFVLTSGAYALAEREVTIDLGAVPTRPVEFTVQGEAPGESAYTAFVLQDGGNPGIASHWIEVRDGDTDEDHPEISKRQTYIMRGRLIPSPDGFATPTLRKLGARALKITNLDGRATVEGSQWGFDPVEGTMEIPEATIRILRDGPNDGRDAGAELLTQNYFANLEFRVMIGHPELERRYWLHHSTFLLEDVDPMDMSFLCISPLQLLGKTIPDFDQAKGERSATRYANQTPKEIYADLLDGQIGLPARYIGAQVEDTTQVHTNTIRETTGREALDAIAFLADGSVIDSQGQVKFVSTVVRGRPVAHFPLEEFSASALPMGARARIEEYSVPYSWDDEKGAFDKERHAHHPVAASRMGRTYLEAPQRLPDHIARWIRNESEAHAIGVRMVTRFGIGLILWSGASVQKNPHLEPGDTVAVEVDRFVILDPTADTARVLRGRMWVVGVIQQVRDYWGQELTIWVQDFSHFVPQSEEVARKVGRPALYDVNPTLRSVDGSDVVEVSFLAENTDEIWIWEPTVEGSWNRSDWPIQQGSDGRLIVEPEGATVLTTERLYNVSLPPAGSTKLFTMVGVAFRGDQILFSRTWKLPITPSGVGFFIPSLKLTPAQVGSTARLDVELQDPDARTVEISFLSKESAGDVDVGDPSTNSAWRRDLTQPFTTRHEAPLQPKRGTAIFAALGYLDQDGATKYQVYGHVFDPDHVAEITSIEITSSSDGEIMASPTADEDAVEIYVTAQSGGGDPPDPTESVNNGSLAGRSGVIDTNVPWSVGEVGVVKARARNSSGVLGPVQKSEARRGVGEIRNKKYNFGMGGWIPTDPAFALQADSGYIHPSAAGVFQVWHRGAELAPGSKVTSLTVRFYRASSSDTVTIGLYRSSGTSVLGGAVAIAGGAAGNPGTGWQEVTEPVPASLQEVPEDGVLTLVMNIRSNSSASDARFLRGQLNYSVSDVHQGI